MTYPTIMPALTLDFQNSQQLDPRVTFSRSSSATYINSAGLVVTAADHEARFDHDPVTGECLGLLVEESRTNSLTHSEEFDNAAWTKTRTTITANAATAPDGTTTADKLIRGTDNNINVVYQAASLPQATYTLSVFAKKGEYTFCTLTLPNTKGWNADRWVSVNLADGSYTTSASAPTSTSVVAYQNGWHRISITHPASATVARAGHIEARSSAGFGIQAGDGTSGIYIWGAQLEEGSFPTSYIPTAGSTITRSQDIAEITGTNFSSWYNQNEGSLVVEYSDQGFPKADGGYKKIVTISENNLTLMTSFRGYSLGTSAGADEDKVQFVWWDDAGRTYGTTASTLNKAAITYSSDPTDGLAYDGTIVKTRTNGQPKNTMIGLYLFQYQTIARLSYYNERLTDAELQTITL